MSAKIKSKVNYKSKYLNLKKKYNNLLTQNNVLQMFNSPTNEQRVKIIEDYYDFLSANDYDANTMQAFCDYKQFLKNNCS